MLIFNFLKLPFIAGFLEKYIGPNWKRIIILSFGQIVGIILAISGGMGILDSIIAGLFTSGFATFLFEQIKPLFSKDPPPVLK
jgi:hypothetical protein